MRVLPTFKIIKWGSRCPLQGALQRKPDKCASSRSGELAPARWARGEREVHDGAAQSRQRIGLPCLQRLVFDSKPTALHSLAECVSLCLNQNPLQRIGADVPGPGNAPECIRNAAALRIGIVAGSGRFALNNDR